MEMKKEDRQKGINGELIVPRRILMMEEKCQSGLTDETKIGKGKL